MNGDGDGRRFLSRKRLSVREVILMLLIGGFF